MYLDQDAKRIYLELQVYNPVTEWDEFKQLWIDNFHEKTYDRLWTYLTTRETNGNLVEFAQKKHEVLRNFFKTISDLEIIQLINVSMPQYIQSTLMSKMFSSFSGYIKFVKEEEEKLKQMEEDEENEEEDEEEDEEDQEQEQEQAENEIGGENGDNGEESDPGLMLFK